MIILTHNNMERYITRDKLADFVETMWDNGCRAEFVPAENLVKCWSSSLSTVREVRVFDKKIYANMVTELVSELKEKEVHYE